MKPKVSVFIPAWNAEHFIAATISSILDQDYQNIELIVINNGSTDGTQSVLEKIKLKDPRLIIVYLKEGVSPFKARQIGFELSTGVFCMPFKSRREVLCEVYGSSWSSAWLPFSIYLS